jgi:hypothetical protein
VKRIMGGSKVLSMDCGVEADQQEKKKKKKKEWLLMKGWSQTRRIEN